jgi:peptidoglycan/LPS O-acetylase OafA/YrhL
MQVTRRTVRYAAAAIAATMAAIYYLIALDVLSVVEPAAGAPGMFEFGAMAGTAFLLGALLLGFFDRRILWVIGATFQALAFALYIGVAPAREPPFELWGLTLRVLQVALFAALVYLAVRAPDQEVSSSATSA